MIGQILTTLVLCLGAVMATTDKPVPHFERGVIMANQPETGKPNAAATVAGSGWNGEGDNGEPIQPPPEYDNGEPNNPPEPVNEGNGEPNQGERLARMEAALRKANHEAAASRKKLEAFERAEQERKQAEMTELERAQQKLATLEAEANALKLKELQRQAATEAGIPLELASRLHGATLDDLKADAEGLAKLLPKPTKTPPNVAPTNPGGNASGKGETDDQRRARIYGQGGNPFDPAKAAQHGGGVIFKNKE